MGRLPKKLKQSRRDNEFLGKMDDFANELMDKARVDDVSLQTRLDTFKELARWVAVKNRLSDLGDAGGESLDELRRRLRASQAPPRSGAARAANRGGDPFTSSYGRYGRYYPDGEGGAALDAIKRKLPGADDGDDAGPGAGS